MKHISKLEYILDFNLLRVKQSVRLSIDKIIDKTFISKHDGNVWYHSIS